MSGFSKGYCSHSFHPISNKLHRKHDNQGGIETTIFWRSAKFLKCYGTLNFWTIDHIKLGISNRCSSYSFLLMSNVMRALATMGNIGLLFLAIGTSLKQFVILWNFNMGFNGKIINCAISWKWLAVERNRWSWFSPSICSVLFGSGHLSSV